MLGAHDKKRRFLPIPYISGPKFIRYSYFIFWRGFRIYIQIYDISTKKNRSKFHGPVPSHKIWPPIFLKFLQRQTLKGYKIKTDCENGWIYIRFKIQIWLQKIKKKHCSFAFPFPLVLSRRPRFRQIWFQTGAFFGLPFKQLAPFSNNYTKPVRWSQIFHKIFTFSFFHNKKDFLKTFSVLRKWK